MNARGMQRLRTIAITGLTVAALAFATPSAANAVTNTDGPDSDGREVHLTTQQQLDIEATVAASDQANQTFDVGTAAAAGSTEQGIADAAAVLASFGWTILGEAGEPSDSVVSALRACTGFSGPHGYYVPWGYQFGLNSCQTSQLIALVGGGTAAAAAIAAFLVAIGVTAVVGAISALVAALIGVGAAALAVCQAFSSNGAIWLNLGGSPVASCWGQ